jgi:hypothetical protein
MVVDESSIMSNPLWVSFLLPVEGDGVIDINMLFLSSLNFHDSVMF